jgi:hypothetical protein
LENQKLKGKKGNPQTYKLKITYEAQLIGKDTKNFQIHCTISIHGDTNALLINTLTKTNKQFA